MLTILISSLTLEQILKCNVVRCTLIKLIPYAETHFVESTPSIRNSTFYICGKCDRFESTCMGSFICYLFVYPLGPSLLSVVAVTLPLSTHYCQCFIYKPSRKGRSFKCFKFKLLQMQEVALLENKNGIMSNFLLELHTYIIPIDFNKMQLSFYANRFI